MLKVAALFVRSGGVYYKRDDVEPWSERRDARLYPGPYPVVAHPPCQRWGRYWFGGPSAKVRCKLGDDDGCFASALESVRNWGGVIEHPEASHAWNFFRLSAPPRRGKWVRADNRGWTCCVEQGHYGHSARKATWLYVVAKSRDVLPELIWGPSSGARLDEGFHTAAERRTMRRKGKKPVELLSLFDRESTPKPFRDLLISIARQCSGELSL